MNIKYVIDIALRINEKKAHLPETFTGWNHFKSEDKVYFKPIAFTRLQIKFERNPRGILQY